MKAFMLAVLVLLASCGGGNVGSDPGDGEDGVPTPVTVPAEGVELSMQAAWRKDSLVTALTVTNRTEKSYMVVPPSHIRPDGDARFVALLPEVEPGSGDALTTNVAPPSHPAIFVEQGSTIDISHSLGRFAQSIATVEICLEVAGAESNTGDLESGDMGSVTYRIQGEPAPLACSGPVEIVDEE